MLQKRSSYPYTHKIGKSRRLELMRIMMKGEEQRLLVNRAGCFNLKDVDIKAMLKSGHVTLIRSPTASSIHSSAVRHSYIKMTRKGRVYFRANTK